MDDRRYSIHRQGRGARRSEIDQAQAQRPEESDDANRCRDGLHCRCGGGLFPQTPRAIVSKPADAFLSEPFGSIHSIRELADGRVLISDASSENRLVVADLRTGRVRLVGSNGAGPGEYRQKGALFGLSGDSTLFVNSPARGRWWLLLVLRAHWSGAMETIYDVFDRTGARIATMQLPDSELVVGFGSRSVYVSVRDDDGIVRLRRHPWP